MRRRLLLLVPLLTALTVGGCSLWPDGEFPPGGASRMNQPGHYLLYWKLVEECAHRRRQMNVQWFTTNGALIQYGDQLASGAYRGWPDRIALANPANGAVVRHEMLHAILGREGHPLAEFAGSCDGFVSFDAPEDYGLSAAEAELAVTVAADAALTVTVQTVPAQPSIHEYDGRFVFVITATNTTNRTVWIPFRAQDPVFAQYTDSTAIRYSAVSLRNARTYFRPGQSRRVLVDGKIFKTGTYEMIGGYGRARSSAVTLELRR